MSHAVPLCQKSMIVIVDDTRANPPGRAMEIVAELPDRPLVLTAATTSPTIYLDPAMRADLRGPRPRRPFYRGLRKYRRYGA